MSTKSNSNSKKSESFRKPWQMDVDAFYNAQMSTLNNFCLEHPDDDLFIFESFMAQLLQDWIRRIQWGGAPNTPNFRKWVEVVSRWEPIFQYAEEIANSGESHFPKELRHVDELPDEY